MSITQNWINKNDLINAFGMRDLPIDENGDISDEKISNSVDYAVLYVESYLRSVGITLPASEVIKSELKECVLNITRYSYSNSPGAMTEEIRKRQEFSLSYLNKIISGSVVLSDKGKNAGWSQMKIYRV